VARTFDLIRFDYTFSVVELLFTETSLVLLLNEKDVYMKAVTKDIYRAGDIFSHPSVAFYCSFPLFSSPFALFLRREVVPQIQLRDLGSAVSAAQCDRTFAAIRHVPGALRT